MAYNYFPASYQPAYSMYQNPQAGGNNGIIWVQGIEAARAYQVAPGASVALWDSDSQSIYLKSADQSGLPSLRILDYTIRAEAAKTAQNALASNGADVLTRKDFDALQSQINALRAQINGREGAADEPTV